MCHITGMSYAKCVDTFSLYVIDGTRYALRSQHSKYREHVHMGNDLKIPVLILFRKQDKFDESINHCNNPTKFVKNVKYSTMLLHR